MLWGGHDGGLEVRRAKDGATRLRGRFPYNKRAVLSDGGRTGRPRKEKFAPRAFAYRVERPKEDIHLLVGHDYSKPLASKGAGTLNLTDTAEALIFDATIAPEIEEVSYVRDALAAFAAGLIVGLSPGFRIPPQRAVKEAETIEEEPDDGSIDEDGNPRRGAIIRTVHHALLYEMSLVTRPAYPDTQIEARNWEAAICEAPDAGLRRVLNRWRA